MKNLYHPDIYKFHEPIKSYWENTTSEKFNIEKLKKNESSEILVIGGGYTGLLCAINLIENHGSDVILVDAGKIGWGASSRNAGFCSISSSKMPIKMMKKIYGNEETTKFFKNSIEGVNFTKDIIEEFKIDCDVSGDKGFVVAHHPKKFEEIKKEADIYSNEFGIQTKIYSKEKFKEIGHSGTEQFGAYSYEPCFAINPLIISIAAFLDFSSGAATVTSPVSFTSTFAPDVSTISLIVAPPLPITVAISFLSTLIVSIFGVCFENSFLDVFIALFISFKICSLPALA